MIINYVQKIYKEINKGRLKVNLEEISRFHRIQASPGFKKAAEYCIGILQNSGVHADLLSYPAKEGVYFQTFPSFQEWHCHDAWCVLSETGEKIVDFKGNPMSIIQRSASWFEKEKLLEIVELAEGADEKSYQDIDINGKLIFVHDSFTKYKDWAIDKRGAVGIISDYVDEDEGCRERYDQLDIFRYTSFWWKPNEKRTFGFVLSPRQGDRLKKLCQKLKKDGKNPTVTCFVDSELINGELNNVTAFIPGETDEEILLVAHLCHPKYSSNDNASGSVAVLEAICTLKRMLDEAKLPPLKRGIRALLTPEYTGTFAYLNSLDKNNRRKIVAAITLDMVGGRQNVGYGPLILHETPHSTPSIVNSIARLIFNELRKDYKALNSVDFLPLFNSYISEFIDGSDHSILNDPLCGIPSPLLCQWPDKNYHTSGDTPDVIDYEILQKSSCFSASFGYLMSNFAEKDLPLLLNSNFMELNLKIGNLVQEKLLGRIEEKFFNSLVNHYISFYMDSCNDCLEYFRGESKENIEKNIQVEKKRIMNFVSEFVTPNSFENKENENTESKISEWGSWVPKRKFFGPASFMGIKTTSEGQCAIDKYNKRIEEYKGEDFTTLAVFYMNGLRTIDEIIECVQLDLRTESRVPVKEFVDLLFELGLVSFENMR